MSTETGWMDQNEIASLGLKDVGSEVKIDRSVRILNPSAVTIGAHSRIDAGVILSSDGGDITIGRHVHIGAYSIIQGGGGVVIEDFAGLSYRCTILSVSDDFLTGYMTNPTISESLRRLSRGEVYIRKHSVIGAGCTILMGTELEFGSAIGSHCKIGPKKTVPAGAIVSCDSKRPLAFRNIKRLASLESEFKCACLSSQNLMQTSDLL